MDILFSMDKKDYDESWPVFKRPSVRGVIIKNGQLLLVKSEKYKYYKFPGGGIEEGETETEALIREIKEETGYSVVPDSVKEYGSVLRRQADSFGEELIFEQENKYFFCDVEDEKSAVSLDDYENEEGFKAEWIYPLEAQSYNRYNNHGDYDPDMIKRDTKVLDMIDILLRKRTRIEKEEKWFESLGKTYYREMYEYVKNRLNGYSEFNQSKQMINYLRSEHTERVLGWSVKLYNAYEDKSKIDYDTLVIASIFHDVGYNDVTEFEDHATAGARITREYLESHGFDKEKTDRVCYLVGSHSDKWRMWVEKVDPDLIMLMEADLFDDTGATGIVMDCMIEEAKNPEATMLDSYDHINRFSVRIQNRNPMFTEYSKKLWNERTRFVENFAEKLRTDIEPPFN